MKYSMKSLKLRSDCGALCKAPETFSTNFVRDAASGLASVPDSEIIEAALKILSKRMSRGSLLASPRAARDYLALRFGQVEHEVFSAIYLTKRHQVIACEELFRGTLDGASVHPRIVVKEALRHNAAALIITPWSIYVNRRGFGRVRCVAIEIPCGYFFRSSPRVRAGLSVDCSSQS